MNFFVKDLPPFNPHHVLYYTYFICNVRAAYSRHHKKFPFRIRTTTVKCYDPIMTVQRYDPITGANCNYGSPIWASEASPTLGCSIEISRDIYMSVCLSCPKMRRRNYVKANAQSQIWAVKIDLCMTPVLFISTIRLLETTRKSALPLSKD